MKELLLNLRKNGFKVSYDNNAYIFALLTVEQKTVLKELGLTVVSFYDEVRVLQAMGQIKYSEEVLAKIKHMDKVFFLGSKEEESYRIGLGLLNGTQDKAD